jgi:hypothetical protein
VHLPAQADWAAHLARVPHLVPVDLVEYLVGYRVALHLVQGKLPDQGFRALQLPLRAQVVLQPETKQWRA